MRSASNTSAEIISKIPNESLVTIKDVIKIGNTDSWYKVTYNSTTGWVSANYVDITSSTRLVIDLENTLFAIDTKTDDINYEIIKAIRFGNQGNNLNRIVLDLNQITGYKVAQNEEKTITYLALSENFKIAETTKGEEIYVATNDDKLYIPNDELEDNKFISGDEQNNKIEDKEDDNKTNETVIIKELSNITSIKYSSSTNKTRIKIDGEYEITDFTLTNPDRIVLDIKGAKLSVDGPTEIMPNNKNLTAIRFSQNEEDVVRVVFDVNSGIKYNITEDDDEIAVVLEETTYKNVDYVAYNNYSTVILKDTDIDYFEIDKSSDNDKCYITYSSTKFKSGKGTIEIYDDFVEKITIKSNKITIHATGKMSYSAKQVEDDVIVTIKEKTKSSTSDRVILLDAGHGGSDPGACNGSIYEKVYNLKIALKLYELLEETDGIEVRISREDDAYISRDGRLEFVLDNDDADLVVSIHNNSLANKNYQGSMVLFYNKPGEKEEYGITSKEFATIVKNNLISELGTIDRGAVSRDDLWILTQNNLGERPDLPITNIPSILCEVIFISNDEEAARLQTEEFQEKTAEAIYDGIMEALSIMDENE